MKTSIYSPKVSVSAAVALASVLALLSGCSRPEAAAEPVRAVKVVTVGEQAQTSQGWYAGEVRARVE